MEWSFSLAKNRNTLLKVSFDTGLRSLAEISVKRWKQNWIKIKHQHCKCFFIIWTDFITRYYFLFLGDPFGWIMKVTKKLTWSKHMRAKKTWISSLLKLWSQSSNSCIWLTWRFWKFSIFHCLQIEKKID